MVDARTLSTLIGSIYDCAIDPSRWDETLADFRGKSLPYFTTHDDLVKRQGERKAAQKAAAAAVYETRDDALPCPPELDRSVR